MSIVKMQKLTVIGHDSIRNDLIHDLMTLGVVEITSQEEKFQSGSEWKHLIKSDANETAVRRYDNWISRANLALETLDKYSSEKKPLFNTRKLVSRSEFNQIIKDHTSIEKQVEVITGLANQLNQLAASQNKIESTRVSLLPWKDLDIPLQIQATRETDLLLGTIPASADVSALATELGSVGDLSCYQMIGKDTEQHYLYLICHRQIRTKIDDILKSYGYSKSSLGALEGTAAENIALLEHELTNLSESKEMVIASIRSEEINKEAIQFLHDDLMIGRSKAQVRSRLLITKKTFYLEGYMPKKLARKVEELLEAKECYYETRDPEHGEEFPVLLANDRFSSPFESITKLYALPDSRGIDATPFFSLSYAIFFGLMLGDAAYGLIMVVVTYVIMKKFRLEGTIAKMMKMFFYCGISTIFWGLAFGTIFGDVIAVVSRTFFQNEVLVPALWFNPMEKPMQLLVFSFILGGIHLFIGMGLSGWMMIRDGRPLDALFDVGFWYTLLIGLVLWFTGFGGAAGQYLAIAGALGILLTAGREKKGIFGKLFGGLGALYGVTSYISDVLSYARLLALGLATGVIASVVNTLGSLAGGGFLGLVIFLVAFIVGHGYNMAIGLLGSFVHTCRLQYVEFFGKFYLSGGEAFEPFYENTKYIQISKEEN